MAFGSESGGGGGGVDAGVGGVGADVGADEKNAAGKETYDNDVLFAAHANTSNGNVATDLEV
jgi:hypothetical protein